MKHKQKKFKFNIGIFCLFMIGLAVLLYPFAANCWNSLRQQRLINAYEETTEALPDDEAARMLEEADAYNAQHRWDPVPDAFAAQQDADEAYMQLLNQNGDGVMGYLEIPKLNINAPILHGTAEDTLEEGIGHLAGSSLPVGGASTHAVLAGHRGLPSAKLFTDLPLLEEGDLFYIHVLGEVLAYRIDDVRVVEPEETDALAVTAGEDDVTLVTCTPYGVNSHRLLVRGRRTEYVGEEYEQAQADRTASVFTSYGLVAVLGLAVVALVALLLYLHDRRKRKAL